MNISTKCCLWSERKACFTLDGNLKRNLFHFGSNPIESSLGQSSENINNSKSALTPLCAKVDFGNDLKLNTNICIFFLWWWVAVSPIFDAFSSMCNITLHYMFHPCVTFQNQGNVSLRGRHCRKPQIYLSNKIIYVPFIWNFEICPMSTFEKLFVVGTFWSHFLPCIK